MAEELTENRELQYAAELKRQKRGETEKPEAASGSLRQRIARARFLKEQAREKTKEKLTSPARRGTAALLKFSWLNLIDSFGLTLIYINMHVFFRWVFPSMFCKLGDEWLPKQVSVLSSEANQAAGVSRFLGITEVIGLLFLDLLFLFVILGVLGLLGLITSWILNPLNLLKDIYNLGGSFFKVLADLFLP